MTLLELTLDHGLDMIVFGLFSLTATWLIHKWLRRAGLRRGLGAVAWSILVILIAAGAVCAHYAGVGEREQLNAVAKKLARSAPASNSTPSTATPSVTTPPTLDILSILAPDGQIDPAALSRSVLARRATVLGCFSALIVVLVWSGGIFSLARVREKELGGLVQLRTGQLEEAIKLDRSRLDMLEVVVEQRTGELRHAATHDKLTKLPNRSGLSDRLFKAVRERRNYPGASFAVLFLDLDDFKIVNDTLGHEVGDTLLREVARRLSEVLGVQDTRSINDRRDVAARLGGDEFVILLHDLVDPPADALKVGQKIIDAIAVPFDLGTRQARCGVSIGITTSNMFYDQVEHVLRDADIAMYHAKEQLKSCCVLFNEEMHKEIVARVTLEEELREAMEQKQLVMHYQPIVSLSDGQLAGFEALVRWNHPTRGLLPPGVFIPLAEETGLIVELGLWTFEETAQQIVKWQKRFPKTPVPVTVNLSPKQFNATLAEDLNGIVARTGVDPSRLILEVTEGSLATDNGSAERIIASLRKIGVRTYVDDFGTGYSSLARLPKMQISGVKIDRVFLTEAGRDRGYAAIINAIVQLARNMDAVVVGEGIESPEQIALLQALDCDRGQGHYFCPPNAPGDVERFFMEGWHISSTDFLTKTLAA